MDYGLVKWSCVTRLMPYFAEVNSVIAYLRQEIPAEDISANPVVVHPHNTSRTILERLPPAIVKELSQLDTARALAATAGEWVSIAAAIALCTYFWHPVLYVLAVMFIGARQHALIILGHDASHLSLSAEALAQRALQQPLPDVAGVRLG